MISILYKVFQEIEAEGTHPNSLYEESITLIPNQIKALQESKTIDQYLS